MSVTEIVGVYDADGGLLGEAAYVWGKVRGTRHCGLCDITHSTVRRKGEWDRMVARLPVPVRLLHLNELDDDLRAAVSATRAPVVLAREAGAWRELVGVAELDDDLRAAVSATRAPVVLAREAGAWRELVGVAELDEMAGSVDAFEAAVRRRLDEEATG